MKSTNPCLNDAGLENCLETQPRLQFSNIFTTNREPCAFMKARLQGAGGRGTISHWSCKLLSHFTADSARPRVQLEATNLVKPGPGGSCTPIEAGWPHGPGPGAG